MVRVSFIERLLKREIPILPFAGGPLFHGINRKFGGDRLLSASGVPRIE
jgi:hypothetical protein